MTRLELIDTIEVAKIIDRSPGHTRDRVIHSPEFTPRKFWDSRDYKFIRDEVEKWYFDMLKRNTNSRNNPASFM